MHPDARDGVPDLVGQPRGHLSEQPKAGVEVLVLLRHFDVRQILEKRADTGAPIPLFQHREREADHAAHPFPSRQDRLHPGREVLEVQRFEQRPEKGVIPRDGSEILADLQGVVVQDLPGDFVLVQDGAGHVDREDTRTEALQDVRFQLHRHPRLSALKPDDRVKRYDGSATNAKHEESSP